MSKRVLPLRQSAEVTLNALGYGKVSLGPTSYDVLWKVERCSVRVAPVSPATAVVLEPVFSLYYAGIGNANFISGSYTGSRDDDPAVNTDVPANMVLWAEWTGGDIGAVATVILAGRQEIG